MESLKIIEPFKFSDRDVQRLVQYDLKLLDRIGSSFNYVHAKLKELGNHTTTKFNEKKFMKGKNYDWCAYTKGSVRLLIRTYDEHLTVFTSNDKIYKRKGKYMWTDHRFGAFTYHVKTNKIKRKDVIEGIPQPDKDVKYISDYYSDYLYDDRFKLFNSHLNGLVKMVSDNNVQSLWNEYSFPRQKFIKIKNVFEGESIASYDQLIFCGEELSHINMMLFAENEMVEAIKRFKVGDTFGGGYEEGKITKVATEVKDDYYHDVGLRMTLKHNGEDKWIDVYSLTSYYYENIFPKEKKK